MKVLTLTQPWASLVANGSKKIETRSWRTNYRGPIAIHAAKGFPKWAQDECALPAFRDAIWPLTVSMLPTGVILCTTTLIDCKAMGNEDADPHFDDDTLFDIGWGLTPSERRFGNYEDGRFAWILSDINVLAEPISAKGALGLWEFPISEVAA